MAEPQNGRIGGGVLADNLLRQGIDLNFKNTSSDTALLHFDVNASRIGVNIESPGDALHVVSTFKTTNLEAPFLNIANFSIQDSEINANVGNINFNAADNIFATSIQTDDIKIDFNTISTVTPDTDIEIRPDGSGTLEIHANWNITGSLHSTGDITFGNNFTIGNDANDSLDFNAEIQSDIIPDANNTYSLGNSSKQWRNLYSNLLNGQRVEVEGITVNDTSLALRQGNIFYVSTLGDDNNVGDHQHGAFRTIRHALAIADASSGGPVTIHVFPGEYEEELPLVLPERVTISGEDLRNTIIVPDTASQYEDVFYLNQNCTIENITIKNFYYDSLNDKGYAFSFAPGAVIVERSPYIRNVTVITQGSVISSTDPRGFAAGDAGKGALIDGAVIDSNSRQASMLFHSATFITPGVDCITMTNGVRVEWLNSFTYFANRGLYATQGTGRTLSDGSTIEFGAEVRSIGSANVYGNYGAVADGVNTLMYLIGHNFAYIGAGKNVSNDRTLTLPDQEIQRLNNGKIYYTSTDADGTFRVGNAFYVDFETGSTSINAQAIDFTGVTSIFINTGGSITYIDGSRIDIGNIRFSGNTISSITGDIIWNAATGFVQFDSNAGFVIAKGNNAQRPLEESDFRYNVTTNLFEGFSSANTSFGGIWSDDRQTSVSANNILGDIVFRADAIETGRISGNADGRWELNGLNNYNIDINNNVIRTTQSNSDLELTPNGASQVKLDKLYTYSSVIENFESTNLSLYNTGRGYVKFNTTGGVVIPYGTNAQRPLIPEIGSTRWNTEEEYLEVYTSTGWARAAGEGASVTQEVLKELVDIYTLVLG